jgi:hypothetical protein
MPSYNLSNLSARQLRHAANLRERIDALEKELIAILGVPAGPTSVSVTKTKRPKRRFSAATRAKMAAAQQARWAARKAGASGKAKAPAPVKKAKKQVSAAARARLSAAAKARWAKVKAAGKKKL